MNYVALRFDVSAAEAEAWSDALIDAGALSVDVSDPFEGTERETPMFGEPGMPPSSLWQMSRVVALLAPDADANAVLARAAQETGLTLPPYETYPVADEDWVRKTQAQFGPIEIAHDFFIVPTWADPPRPDALCLRLDPGLAFGTGSHPTTRLCLTWLRASIRGGETLLDYGCGSGILAIAAAKLGATSVTGVDVDPQAIRASDANAAMNAVTARFAMPDGLDDGRFDIVVANILANPLVLLAPALCARVAPRGAIALSGVLAAQADDVRAAYAPWFTLAAVREEEGWVLLASR
ncbi:MAG: 50S ribosomal protein L11 methyltransferase [Burkholderiales bacterium]